MVPRGDSFEVRISEEAFGESPNPRFLFQSELHARTLAALLENLERGDRLQILTGRAGSGKTTILKAVLERLAGRVDSAYVFYTCGTASDLLGFIIRDFGIPVSGTDLATRHEALRLFLRARTKPVVLVIDEAQILDESAFKAIAKILADAPAYLSVVLSGQAKLISSLGSAPPSLQESVSARHELGSLNLRDAANYVRHRLKVAGYTGRELFTREALQLIATRTEGVPRNINTVCFHALHDFSVTQKAPIDSDAVMHALERCAFTESTLAAELTEKRKAPESASRVAANSGKALRRWLTNRAGVWSGTAWELQDQLASAGAEADSSELFAHLEQTTERGLPAILDCGVEVELRSRAGRPRRFFIRLIEDSSAERKVPA